MGDQIPHRLAQGKLIALEHVSVPVNIGFANSRGSAVGVGPEPESPIGPKVVLSINAAMPTEDRARAHLAHLEPEEALWLASKLMDAAAAVIDAGQGTVQ